MKKSSDIFFHIKSVAAGLGFAATGYAPAVSLEDEQIRYNNALEQGYFAELDYLKRNIGKRIDPRLLVEDAKSVLVFLAPYGNGEQGNNIAVAFGNNTDNPQIKEYKVAKYALGEDYHTVIKGKLNEILQCMKECDNSIAGRAFVDTAPVLERAWAVRAGLGFIGRNNFLISREHGIRNFIGTIISNFEIPQELYSECGIVAPGEWENACAKKYCGLCTRCLDACPTGALCAPYTLDANKCLSYLTIEKKGTDIGKNMELAQERDGWIFGCDACMNACPWNSRNREGWSQFAQKETPLPHTHLKRR